MLSGQKEKMELKESAIYCAKCETEMRQTILPSYEYLEGHPLGNVPVYKCQNCGALFFTEMQASDMEARTKKLEASTFGFERKITISGKSLALTIPRELAKHMNLSQGTLVKITPLAKRGLMIRRV